jgi:hypothetical protein
VTLGKRLRAHFLERLAPDAVFQVSPGFLSGIRVSKKDRTVRAGFVQPFRSRPLVPSFDRPNVTDAGAIEEALGQGMEKLRMSSGTAALLIPEPSLRVFVLSVDSFPGSGRERDSFIRWRIGKQMPLIPEDAMIDYAVTPGRGPRKIIVAMARRPVVREYESPFESAGLRPVLVSVPSLTLVNLVGRGGASNGILINLEDENLTLFAVLDSGWALYRQKSVGPAGPDEAGARSDNIVREAENTIRFLEDKEKTRIERLWVRSSAAGETPELASRLKERIDLPIEPVEYRAPEGWTEAQKALLAPLAGQIA